MKELFHKLIAIDKAIYEIHHLEYDPVACIKEFWSHYDMDSCRNHIVELLTIYLDKERKANPAISTADVQHFTIALFRMLMAYFIVHYKRINLSGIEISFLRSNRFIACELESSKEIYDFFYQLSQKH
ncbi:hypothetical protein [Sphingobacterium sp. DR205]|uniref:hypothetical protein n=1 Tax=Sphingobacterium sp. DR205 TaxID=2713573 RepID=UPI0013E4F50C|nr:hypothetical protein [Sphingobacterium sp. DR205]QIH35501.1 hypothetical protein G6053_22635 [Sphingobacterium sp. DR205]